MASVQSKINQIHNRIITLEITVQFKADCEKSMQPYLHMWKTCHHTFWQIHVENIEIDNKIESDFRESIYLYKPMFFSHRYNHAKIKSHNETVR